MYPAQKKLHHGKDISRNGISFGGQVLPNIAGAQKYLFFSFPSITAHTSYLLELLPKSPFVFSSLLFLHLWRREKQKIIWYVSSTTNCCYKENIDIIYNGFTGVYRKDITLTILPQVILFVLYHMSFPWFLDLLCCFTILWNK